MDEHAKRGQPLKLKQCGAANISKPTL